jgi:hypothetical protein
MVSNTKSLYCIVLLALVLTSYMAGAAPLAGENYNIDTIRQLIRRTILKIQQISKRDLKYSFAT